MSPTDNRTRRPFAVFDIDGTLLRWQLYHAVTDQLIKLGKFDGQDYEVVRQARRTWKDRTHQNSYQDYEQTLVRYFERAIRNLTQDELIVASKLVIEEYKDQVYTYTRDLIYDLKKQGYVLFAISASQDEIVSLLAKYYGFNASAGTIYETNNGKYTGQSRVLRKVQKVKTLEKFIQDYDCTKDGSIAVGDSDGDIPMLEFAEKPIAFNPSHELFEYAQSKNWKVVVERKNVVYNLEPSQKGYNLN